MKLRYSISLTSQIVYVHDKNPQFLYVEFEGGYPHIWTECDENASHYPRKFTILPITVNYEGRGQTIPVSNNNDWQFYDEGPGTTEEFNRVRWPNKAPMPNNGEKNPYEDMP